MATVTLIRHGQASLGAADYDQLSELGTEQARHLGAVLLQREEPVQRVLFGTMKRHQQTAAACLEAAGLAHLPQQTLADWNEFNHVQVLERHEPRSADKGWLLAQMLAHDDPGAFFGQFFRAAVDRWISGRYDADYDEPWPQFQARVQRALQQTCAALDKRDHAVVFTSGGCIAAVTQQLLGLTDAATFGVNLTLANAGLTRIRAGKDGLLLLTLNDHSHFSGRHKPLLTFR
jgi:broad specificity phosphatase PhoE